MNAANPGRRKKNRIGLGLHQEMFGGSLIGEIERPAVRGDQFAMLRASRRISAEPTMPRCPAT